MARIARFVAPAFPHVGRERVFFGEDDDALYRDLLASQCRKHSVAIFCLLPTPNHVESPYAVTEVFRKGGAALVRT